MMNTCPPRAVLEQLLDVGLETSLRTRVEEHVEDCGACKKVLDAMTCGVPSILRPLPGAVQVPEFDAAAATTGDDSQIRTRNQSMPNALNLPTRVGRYRIKEEINRGGMGVVLQVEDELFQRPLAMKVLMPSQRLDSPRKERFLRESWISGKLQHPGIPPVQEMGELEDGRPYLIMKLIKGSSLLELLRARSSPAQDLPRFVAIFEQICQTLAYVHSRGILHRDLKPANVMVGAFGEVQVMDWGLAKVLRKDEGGRTKDEKEGEPQTVFSRPAAAGAGGETVAGDVMGTPAYMAPEQARGEVDSLDPRCDVFGLGAILCQILTGQPPFAGSAKDNIRLAMKGDLSDAMARLQACGADPELIELAGKCLSPEVKDRPLDAAAVAQGVSHYQEALQERLKQAEIDKATALVKAAEEQKLRTVEQARSLEERKRRRVSLALAASLVLLVGGAALAGILHQRRLNETQAQALVDQLRTASIAELPRLRDELFALRSHTEPRVRDLLARSRAADKDAQTELNAALVVVEWDAAELHFILERALAAAPEDIVILREILSSQSAGIRQRFEPVVADRRVASTKRLRAQAIMAADGQPVAADFADELAGQMLVEERLQLSAWIRAMMPVKAGLVKSLSRRYAQGKDDEAGVGAALILREYLKGDTGAVVALLDKGGPRQAYLLGEALRDVDQAKTELVRAFERVAPEFPMDIDHTDPDDALDADARRRVKFALALLSAGYPAPVWEACAPAEDPRLRTFLIHSFARHGVSPQQLRRALDLELGAPIRQAIYLAWGEYSPDLWGKAEFEDVVRQVIADYRDHPDPGVHSAAEWLLRQWRQADRLNQFAQQLPREKARGQRAWFANSQGTIFAVIPDPVETVLGIFNAEWAWETKDLARAHRRRIDRTYAIATKEVTFDNFQEFIKECGDYLPKGKDFGKMWSSRSADSPAVQLNWYEAVLFCRWLSEKEGVAEDQQCYPPLHMIKDGMKMPVDYLQRTGYRLPTEAEWEHACRAGSRTRFFFGADPELLPDYGWFDRNATMRTQPVGQLRPNLFGLFDIHGNAFEWCSVRSEEHPKEDSLRELLPDIPKKRFPDFPNELACEAKDRCVLRGGDFPAGSHRLRSGYREISTRDNSWPGSGLRLAKTLHSPVLDVACSLREGAKARFDIRGKSGRYRLIDLSGDIVADKETGTIPNTVEIASKGGVNGAYSFTVEHLDVGERVAVADSFLKIPWTVRWYGCEYDAERPLMRPSAEAWAKAARSVPFHEESKTELSFSWGWPVPVPNAPPLHFFPSGEPQFPCFEGGDLGGGHGMVFAEEERFPGRLLQAEVMAISRRWLLVVCWDDGR